MITPAPTSPIAGTLARGTYEGLVPATSARQECVKMAFLGTSYEMHLVPTRPVKADVGKRLIGIIRAQARRIDIVKSGGRYVEPVIGRPRRVQGPIVAIEPSSNSIVVDAGMPIHCTCTDPRQQAQSFEVGQFVSFDVLDGSTFTQAD